MTLDASQFFHDYVSATTDQYWNEYHDNSCWTACVTALIKDIIEKYGQTSQTEYYRIDITGWISHWERIADEATGLGLKPHLWDLKTAVEHENDNTDWTDELVKLAHIRCPLKVVIGYTPCDNRGKGGLEDQRLTFAAKLLHSVEAFHEESLEQYLVILGNSAPRSSRNPMYTDFGYKGYLYDYTKHGFFQID